MFIRNGKTWVTKLQSLQVEFPVDGVKQIAQKVNNCPYDNAELKVIYDYTYYTGAMTEYPDDWLPATFKKTLLESISIYECKTCQKHFVNWINVDNSQEFAEVKVLPDGNYSREGEVGATQPAIPQGEQIYGQQPKSDNDCDCNGECDKHECDNNKMNPNNNFNRPDFYG